MLHRSYPYLCLQGRSSPSRHCCGSGRYRVPCWAPDPPEVGSYLWCAPNTSPAAHWVSRAAPLSGPSAHWAQTHSSPQSPAAPLSTHTHPRAAETEKEMIKEKKEDRENNDVYCVSGNTFHESHTKGSYIKLSQIALHSKCAHRTLIIMKPAEPIFLRELSE